MSQLGKIFLYAAVAGAAVAAIALFLVIQQRSGDAADLTQSKSTAITETQLAKKAEAEAEAATTAQKQAESDLADQKSKLDDLTTKLNDAQSKQTTLEDAVKNSQDATAKVQAQLDHINTVLAGQSPEDIKAQVDKLNSQVAADNAEQKILQDQLQAAVKQAADYKVEINKRKTGDMPPGVSGKITFVNRTWNFVVLNVGLSNGVVPSGELIVYRGRDFIGKVKVTSAEDNTCVADILPGAKGDVQVGDDVLN